MNEPTQECFDNVLENILEETGELSDEGDFNEFEFQLIMELLNNNKSVKARIKAHI